MKKIEAFEAAKSSGKTFKELGINGTMFWAYQTTQQIGKELLDFSEVIFDSDIEPIVKACKEYGITEFTVSSDFSGLIRTLAEFEKYGCKVVGITKTTEIDTYADFMTGERNVIPAMLIKL